MLNSRPVTVRSQVSSARTKSRPTANVAAEGGGVMLTAHDLRARTRKLIAALRGGRPRDGARARRGARENCDSCRRLAADSPRRARVRAPPRSRRSSARSSTTPARRRARRDQARPTPGGPRAARRSSAASHAGDSPTPRRRARPLRLRPRDQLLPAPQRHDAPQSPLALSQPGVRLSATPAPRTGGKNRSRRARRTARPAAEASTGAGNNPVRRWLPPPRAAGRAGRELTAGATVAPATRQAGAAGPRRRSRVGRAHRDTDHRPEHHASSGSRRRGRTRPPRKGDRGGRTLEPTIEK